MELTDNLQAKGVDVGGKAAEGLSETDRERVRRALSDALAPATRRVYLGQWALRSCPRQL